MQRIATDSIPIQKSNANALRIELIFSKNMRKAGYVEYTSAPTVSADTPASQAFSDILGFIKEALVQILGGYLKKILSTSQWWN